MARADRCVALPRFLASTFPTNNSSANPPRAKTERAKPDLAKPRFHRIHGAALLACAVLLSDALPAASAEYRGTQDQQQACTPDVMRLCSDSVPDVNRIVACLRRNRTNLSAPCGAVFGVGASHRPRRG